jgi:hypothetical protein
LTKDLAKFGYRPDMIVEKFKNPFTFWLLVVEPVVRNLVIFKISLFSKYDNLSSSFSFPEKSFVCVKIIIFRLDKMQKFAQNKNTASYG